MPLPQVNDRLKEIPAQALRTLFATVGQLLLVADRLRARAAEQLSGSSEAAAPPPQKRPQPRPVPRSPPQRRPRTRGAHGGGRWIRPETSGCWTGMRTRTRTILLLRPSRTSPSPSLRFQRRPSRLPPQPPVAQPPAPQPPRPEPGPAFAEYTPTEPVPAVSIPAEPAPPGPASEPAPADVTPAEPTLAEATLAEATLADPTRPPRPAARPCLSPTMTKPRWHRCGHGCGCWTRPRFRSCWTTRRPTRAGQRSSPCSSAVSPSFVKAAEAGRIRLSPAGIRRS